MRTTPKLPVYPSWPSIVFPVRAVGFILFLNDAVETAKAVDYYCD
jgi:hypothetical protein